MTLFKQLKSHAKVILISNIKGGIGKTTTAVNLASILALLGFKVLLIDTDPQGNASDTSRVLNVPNTIYTIAKFNIDPKSCIYPSEFGYDLIPSESRFKESIPYLMEDNYTFSRMFEPLREEYDFIIVDSLPTENKVVLNNLFFADYLIAPITPTRYSVEGFSNLASDILEVKKEGAKVEILGLLIVKYKRRQSNQVYLEQARNDFGNLVFDAVIEDKPSVEVCEALQMPLVHYMKKDPVTKQYIELTFEILERIGIESLEYRRTLNKLFKKRGALNV